MKKTLLSFFIAVTTLFTLTSCELWPSTYSESIDFHITANCTTADLLKIEDLFKKKGLLMGDKIMVSIIVEVDATSETCKREMRDKVKEIVNKSATLISPKEFHALKTNATQVTYVAKTSIGNEIIATRTTDYGKVN